jgi:XTP/dITP diphosphohydrolase
LEIKSICIATRNKGKLEEYRAFFMKEKLAVEIIPYDSNIPEDVEKGNTFYENAINKAIFVSNSTGLPALADDSGLLVHALNGEPGVKSKRWMGIEDDEERNRFLLEKMKGIKWEERKATFVCVIAFVLPRGLGFFVRGEVNGYILDEMRGKNGFGYDPVFFYPPAGKTFAEMEMEEKNSLSHRALAFKKFALSFSALKKVLG